MRRSELIAALDAINACWDLRILVDVDVIEKKYRLRYEPAWQTYLERERPATKANLIVRNQDLQNPTLALNGHV
jgi:hypothetical protein